MKEEFEQFKKEQNKRIKKYFVFIIITAIVLGVTTGVGAYQMSAREINFTPSNNKWKVNNVSDAIDDLLFKKVSNNYSTEEQVVGEWINGKPIYQKAVEIKTVLASDAVITVSENIDELVDYGGQGYYRTAKIYRPFPWIAATNQAQLNGINDSRTGFIYYCDSATNNMQPGSKIWFQYTKTTDSATN